MPGYFPHCFKLVADGYPKVHMSHGEEEEEEEEE